MSFLLTWQWLDAQTAQVVAGGDGDCLAFSIGQAVAGTAASDCGSAEIGVQQTYVLQVTGFDPTLNTLSADVSVYPNPTSSSVSIKIDSSLKDEIHYRLVAVNGQTVAAGSFAATQLYILDMQSLPAATYILHVEQAHNGFDCQIIKR